MNKETTIYIVLGAAAVAVIFFLWKKNQNAGSNLPPAGIEMLLGNPGALANSVDTALGTQIADESVLYGNQQ